MLKLPHQILIQKFQNLFHQKNYFFNSGLALFFLGFNLLMVGCSTPPAKIPIDKPFLYEVKKDSRQGYLFGTIHTGVMAQDLPDFFWNYFTAAESFAGESNLTKRSERKF